MSLAAAGGGTPAARLLLLVVIALAAAAVLATQRLGRISHPDEVIATAVADRLARDGGVDTNWKRAELPEAFRVPQYNFSGFLLAISGVHRMLNAAGPFESADSPRRLALLRGLNAAWFALALAMAAAIAGELGAGTTGRILAAVVAASCPSFFMEALYLRADTMATALALVAAWCFLRTGGDRRALAALAFVAGFLVSLKVSFLALYPLLWLAPWTPPRRLDLRALAAAHALWLGGFALGAPGALANPHDLLAGIRALDAFYRADFPPHGLGPESALWARGLHALSWLAETWALPVALAATGALACARGRQRRALVVLAPFAALFAHFSLLPVFIERNVTPSLVVLAPFAACGAVALARRVPWSNTAGGAAVLVALAVFWPAALEARIAAAVLEPRDPTLRRGVVAARHGPVEVLGWTRPDLSRHRAGRPPVVEVYHAYDRATAAWLGQQRSAGWREVARHESRFEGLVPSTFHTYLSEGVIWLSRSSP